MPIPNLDEFWSETVTYKIQIGLIEIRRGYGGNIAKVYAALEDYWQHGPNAPDKVQEMLLYNLWKQAYKWLKLKQGKIERDGGDRLERRRLAVSNLRDAAMAELAEISPRTREALRLYEDRKVLGPLGGQLKPLEPGYSLERDIWNKQKRDGGPFQGTSLSGSKLSFELPTARRNDKVARKLAQKNFGDLTMDDAFRVQRALQNVDWPVTYLNKLARLQYLVCVSDGGLLCDVNQSSLLMRDMVRNEYMMSVYAMDMYGNVFCKLDFTEQTETIVYQPDEGYRIVKPWNFNHSSFLAGREVLCAGCMHIGYNVRRRRQEAGYLSAIDNSSGHYKPSPDHLRTMLLVLKDQGVDVDCVRVGDWSQGQPVFYWGQDFLDGGNHPWTDEKNPSRNFFFKAPPISLAF
jgi:hypothetical protein